MRELQYGGNLPERWPKSSSFGIPVLQHPVTKKIAQLEDKAHRKEHLLAAQKKLICFRGREAVSEEFGLEDKGVFLKKHV